MSDTFDHWEDAFCSLEYDDGYYGGHQDMQGDPLYYHKYYSDIEVLVTTEKAYLIKFNDEDECWVPKKLVKNLDADSCYIWHRATLKPIKKEVVEDMFDELPDEVVIKPTAIKECNKDIDLKTHYSDGTPIEEFPF